MFLAVDEAFPPSFLQPKTDEDIYARLGQTIPRPSLPEELVLTDESFNTRIKEFEKTAVLFYLSCKKPANSECKGRNFVFLCSRVSGEQDAVTPSDGCLGTAGQE